MPKARLGDLLVKAGVLTESHLRTALAQQRQHGGKLGEHLVRTNLISEQQLAIAVADQLGLVYNDCREAHAQAFSAMIPQQVAEQLQVLPVRYDDDTETLHVAVADPLDEQVAMQLARLTGKRIEMQVAPKSQLRQAVKVAYASIEVYDEGTNEFALVDLAGRESQVVRVNEDEHLPEASVLEMEPVSERAPEEPQVQARAQAHSPFPVQPPRGPAAPAQQPGRAPTPSSMPRRVGPQQPASPPPPAPKPAPQAAQHDAAEEAMRVIWALTDVLIEKGYLSRSELMAKLRSR